MESDINSGLPAYQGYEFQILATGWIALKLIIETKSCQAIVVEPVSGEDIEAELIVDPETATSTLKLDHGQKRILIQIKLRQTGHWTPSEFKEILIAKNGPSGEKGPARRVRPLDLISGNADAYFILLTNAQVNKDLRSYIISNIGNKSEAISKVIKVGKPLDDEMVKRIGILQQYEQERLKLELLRKICG